MFNLMLAAVAGVLSIYVFLLDGTNATYWICVLALSCVVLVLLGFWRFNCFYRKRWAEVFSLASVYLLVYLYSAHVVNAHKANILSSSLEGQEAVVIADLCGLPVKRARFDQVEFCVRSKRVSVNTVSADARSSKLAPTPIDAPVGRYRLSAPSNLVDPSIGFCWRLHVRLKQPRSSYNPWASNYERYLFYREIVALGSIKQAEQVKCEGQSTSIPSVSDWMLPFRYALSEKLRPFLGELPSGGLIRALVLGDRAGITPEQSRILSDTGTQHLMAISGLHVGLVMLVLLQAMKLMRLKRYAVPVLAISGLAYVLMVGFSPSAQRAWMMAMLVLFVHFGVFPRKIWQTFLFALCLVLLLDPLAPLNAGFWFSFSAVFVLLFILKMKLWPSTLSSLLGVQLYLLLFLVAVQATFNVPSSVSAFFANIVAIPWVSLFVLPASLLATVLISVNAEWATSLFGFIDAVLDLLLVYLESSTVASVALVPPINDFGKAALLALVLLSLFLYRLVYLRTVILLVIVVVLLEGKGKSGSSALIPEFWVLDAGQGLSLVWMDNEQAWVYDTGVVTDRYSFARSVLLPFSAHKGLQGRIQGLVISHGDSDHSGDAEFVVKNLQPEHKWVGEPVRTAGLEHEIECESRQAWASMGMSVEVLFPIQGYEPKTSNNHSCVVMATLDNFKVLIMGDLEGAGERAMLEYYAGLGALERLHADVLIAGHHGAYKASSATLLKWVSPKYVVFSAGYQNQFGHPSTKTIDRVRRFETEILRTFDTGALRFYRDASSEWQYESTRKQSTQFWILK